MAPLLFSTSTPRTCQLPPPVSFYWIRQRPSSHARWWRLTNSGRCSKQRHGNRTWIPSELEVKLNTTKAVLAVFHLNNKEAKCLLKVNHNNETLPFSLSPQWHGLLWSNVGQNTHIPLTSWVTSQEKVDITSCTLEVACWLRLGRWSNKL